jgi:hypothetical protein
LINHRNAAQLKEIKEMSKTLDEFKKKNASLIEENKNLTRALSRELGEGVTAGLCHLIYKYLILPRFSEAHSSYIIRRHHCGDGGAGCEWWLAGPCSTNSNAQSQGDCQKLVYVTIPIAFYKKSFCILFNLVYRSSL